MMYIFRSGVLLAFCGCLGYLLGGNHGALIGITCALGFLVFAILIGK